MRASALRTRLRAQSACRKLIIFWSNCFRTSRSTQALRSRGGIDRRVSRSASCHPVLTSPVIAMSIRRVFSSGTVPGGWPYAQRQYWTCSPKLKEGLGFSTGKRFAISRGLLSNASDEPVLFICFVLLVMSDQCGRTTRCCHPASSEKHVSSARRARLVASR